MAASTASGVPRFFDASAVRPSFGGQPTTNGLGIVLANGACAVVQRNPSPHSVQFSVGVSAASANASR